LLASHLCDKKHVCSNSPGHHTVVYTQTQTHTRTCDTTGLYTHGRDAARAKLMVRGSREL
jgi:hypothetical protein